MERYLIAGAVALFLLALAPGCIVEEHSSDAEDASDPGNGSGGNGGGEEEQGPSLAFAQREYRLAIPENVRAGVPLNGDAGLVALPSDDRQGLSISYQLAYSDPDTTEELPFAISGAGIVTLAVAKEVSIDKSPYRLIATAAAAGYQGAAAKLIIRIIAQQSRAVQGQGDDCGDRIGDSLPPCSLALGETVTKRIEKARDPDLFQMQLAGGEDYRFRLRRDPSSGLAFQLVLLDAAGEVTGGLGLQHQHFLSGPDRELDFLFSPITQGVNTYYIQIRPYLGSTGSYSLEMSQFFDDCRGDRAPPCQVVPDAAPFQASIEHADELADIFLVELDAGNAYLFRITPDTAAGRLLDGGLYSPEEEALAEDVRGLASDDPGYKVIEIAYIAEQAGSYYIRVGYRYSGERYIPLDYTVAAETLTIPDSDCSPGGAVACALPLGASTQGMIDFSGDQDQFSVTLEAQKSYQFELADNAPDLVGHIYDNAGVRIEASYMKRGFPLVYKAPASADYTFEVSYRRGSGAYSITASEISDDCADDLSALPLSTACTLTIGVEKEGNLEALNDIDYFAVNLEGGIEYAVSSPRLSGYRFGDLPTYVYDSSGNEINSWTPVFYFIDDIPRTFSPPDSGTYYIRVERWGGLGLVSSLIRYRLLVEEDIAE